MPWNALCWPLPSWCSSAHPPSHIPGWDAGCVLQFTSSLGRSFACSLDPSALQLDQMIPREITAQASFLPQSWEGGPAGHAFLGPITLHHH